MQIDEVLESFGSYQVRQASTDGNQFRITIPADAIREAGITKNTKMGFIPTVGYYGGLNLYYVQMDAVPDKCLKLSLTLSNGSGVVRIPSSFGCSIGIADKSIEWDLVRMNSKLAFRGHTNIHLDSIDIKEENHNSIRNSILSEEEIGHIVQENTEKGRQEHFRYYLNDTRMSSLGWDTDQKVAVTVKHFRGNFALVATPNIQGKAVNITRKFSPAREGSPFGFLVFPNDIIYSVGFLGHPFQEKEHPNGLPQLSWISSGQCLIAAKSQCLASVFNLE